MGITRLLVSRASQTVNNLVDPPTFGEEEFQEEFKIEVPYRKHPPSAALKTRPSP